MDLNMNLASVVAVLTVTAGVTKLLSDWFHARRPEEREPGAMVSQLADLFHEMKTDMREVRDTLRDHSEEHRTIIAQNENLLGDLDAFSRELRQSRAEMTFKITETPAKVAESLRRRGARIP